jgi:hypothetical protein
MAILSRGTAVAAGAIKLPQSGRTDLSRFGCNYLLRSRTGCERLAQSILSKGTRRSSHTRTLCGIGFLAFAILLARHLSSRLAAHEISTLLAIGTAVCGFLAVGTGETLIDNKSPPHPPDRPQPAQDPTAPGARAVNHQRKDDRGFYAGDGASRDLETSSVSTWKGELVGHRGLVHSSGLGQYQRGSKIRRLRLNCIRAPAYDRGVLRRFDLENAKG